MFTTACRCTTRAARHQSSFFTSRFYATAREAKTISQTKSMPTSRLPSFRHPPGSPVRLTPQKNKKIAAAEKLFESGQHSIYRSPSHIGFRFACYSVTVLCFGGVIWYMGTRLWNEEELKSQGLHWIVGTSSRISMVVLGALGAWSFTRSTNFIKALDLVKDRGAVKLLVTVRRPLPFLRPRKILIEPYDFKFDSAIFASVQDIMLQQQYQADLAAEGNGETITPAGATPAPSMPSIGTIMSRMFFSPFHAFRKLFTHEGILKVSIPVKNDTHLFRLDMEGELSNDGQDMIDIGTMKTD